MTLYCDTHRYVGQPRLLSCPNKWIHVIDVLLSASYSYEYFLFLFSFLFFSFFPPLLCSCLSSHTIIMGVACRMRMKSRLLLQLNKVRTQKKCRLVITLPTTLSTIICSGIGLCTHLGTVPDKFQVLAGKTTSTYVGVRRVGHYVNKMSAVLC